MKKWMEKLVNQFDINPEEEPNKNSTSVAPPSMTEDRATLILLIDAYCKNMLDIEQHPIRKVRDTFDNFIKEIVQPKANLEKTLFRFRQFFASYRIDEYTYVQKTFDEFRGIIWDFVDQLAEDLHAEKEEDKIVGKSLEELKEAVEANSIDELRLQSRQFIDTYIEHQTRRELRRSERMKSVKENLDLVKKQLSDANQNMRLDHLTQALNRKSFDEQLGQQIRFFQLAGTPSTIISMDIDHFKKFNDTYGHAIGDFILVECVKLLKEQFNNENELVARVGGEEFCIILPGTTLEGATQRAESTIQRIRKEVWLEDGHELKFTMSMGIAQVLEKESAEDWLKRADEALYASKHNGRNRYTVASHLKNAA
ncbi:MAG: GGDEF domain-containing protein [Bdellovibrionales bacterium]|nr:GGDEF domain-containing protein [Bdellovibrionales bacterium]